MKEQILPMIAGLCETDDEKMMDFDEFFKSAKAIIDKKVVYVFNCNKAEVLHIYSDESERYVRQVFIIITICTSSNHHHHHMYVK